MDDDSPTTSVTCLSPDAHGDNIKDHILHFLGCVEISERNRFLNNSSYVPFEDNSASGATTTVQSRESQAKIREAWRQDCESELRRIAFLRSKLGEDEKEKHLVQRIEESCKAWKNSKEYNKYLPRVKSWRSGLNTAKKTRSEGENDSWPADLSEEVLKEASKKAYNPGLDVNTPFMLFEKQGDTSSVYRPVDEEQDPQNAVWGHFPDQKTNVQRLLFDDQDRPNLLSKHHDQDRIRYFHIPSNNMLWAEEAVSRYYDEVRPEFHPTQRELQMGKKSNAAWILRESHWRGQLHGGRATISSRYMRPFCESIRSEDTEGNWSAEGASQNIVLFMPYMHWETSRNQQRFSQIIENIVYNKNTEEKDGRQEAKEKRQVERLRLNRPKRPKPSALPNRSWLDKIRGHRETNADSGPDLPHNKTMETGPHFGPIRSMTGLLKAQELNKRLNLSGQHPQLDQNGRVDLDEWFKKQIKSQQNRNSRLLHGCEERDPEPRYKLGQYLLDAARLFEGMASYRDRKLLETYLMQDPPMHPRRTLDQAYYWSLNTTNQRDHDQVVYRATTANPLKFHRWNIDRSIWTGHDEENVSPDKLQDLEHKSCEECTTNIRQVSRLIMVDQLWMWVLDEKTIITCFPKRYGANKNDTSAIHKSVRIKVSEGSHRIRSVFDLALIIFEECSNTFFDRTRTTDRQPQVLDEFSEAIGNIMHRQTDGFERLWRWTERASKMYRNQPAGRILSELHIPLLDINPEGKLEKEIKDIVEELGIMIYIKKAEKDVLRCFVDNARAILDPQVFDSQNPDPGDRTRQRHVPTPSLVKWDEYFINAKGFDNGPGARGSFSTSAPYPSSRKVSEAYLWFSDNAVELLKRVDKRINQLEELERSAMSTAEMVKDLLALKQQQAGVVQAWQSVNHSNEAMRQGRSIMVFTIVTIVFLPLSFMSSIFGMNSIELGGDGNVMHLGEQFTYMFSISAGVIVLTLLFSISTSFRTFLWCIYTELSTWLIVRTWLYRLYLRINFTSDDMYEHAVKLTENLKSEQKERYLEARRKSRQKKEEKEASKETSSRYQQKSAQSNPSENDGFELPMYQNDRIHYGNGAA